MRDDQEQVMICNPSQYLRVVGETPIIQTSQVLEICRLVYQSNETLRHLEQIGLIEAKMQEEIN